MKIIAFGHRQQVGKNECAKALERFFQDNEISYKTVAFADKLYEVAYILYAWAGFQTKEYYEKHPKEKNIVLPDIGKSPRQILIDLGTKGVREQVFDLTWVKATLLQQYDCQVLLITDCRFPNEVEEVKRLGGICVKVLRSSEPERDDDADIALAHYDDWDKVVENNGSLDELSATVIQAVEDYLYVS
jgi:hypothetical protein